MKREEELVSQWDRNYELGEGTIEEGESSEGEVGKERGKIAHSIEKARIWLWDLMERPQTSRSARVSLSISLGVLLLY